MGIHEIDKRTKEDIIRQMKEYSKSYTPEWKFDENNLDIGTALALVYGEMFFKTIQLFNKIPEKNKISFFNHIHTSLLPAKPSTGYVTFKLVNSEVPPVIVKEGTRILAQTQDKKIGQISFETTEDLYVIPAEISNIIQAYDQYDYIASVYDKNKEKNYPFTIFDMKYENIQAHEFYFCHQEVFHINTQGHIYVSLYVNYQDRISSELSKHFLNKEEVTFKYYSGDQFIEFDEIIVDEGMITLIKQEHQPPIERTTLNGHHNFWIQCQLKKVKPFMNFSYEKIQVASTGINILPDVIYNDGVECNQIEYLPFGEKMGIYKEVYFGSHEVFSKKNADITLSFQLEFQKIELDSNIEKEEKEMNWVMKSSDFKQNPEYDITINKVIWEYYNGFGWSRLFANGLYEEVFCTTNGLETKKVEIKFKCPIDISKILLNSTEAFYIRARILKMNHDYKLQGQYITPVLSQTRLSYQYSESNIMPEYIFSKNNMESSCIKGTSLSNKNRFTPCVQTNSEFFSVYIGFQKPLIGGPIKLFLSLGENKVEKTGELRWEYYSNGNWKKLNVLDETDNFRKTGIITIMAPEDLQSNQFFNKNLYWIRILDIYNYYGSIWEHNLTYLPPSIIDLNMNTTKAIAANPRKIQMFHIAIGEENISCKLFDTKLIDVQVLVNEVETITEYELNELQEEMYIEQENDEFGNKKAIWVQWTEVSDFLYSIENSRHFVVNRHEGRVTFGNGVQGKIPPVSKEDTIKIKYRSGGGEHTNIKKGEIERLDKTIGFISEVVNKEAFSGGVNQELVSEAIFRKAAFLKNRGRAVTIGDFEQLALEVSNNIKKAACFAGYNQLGKEEKGSVTLVILHKDYKEKSNYFQSLKEEIYVFFQDKISHTLKQVHSFYIAEPKFIEMCVNVEIVVKSYQQVFYVKEQIEEKLEQFFDAVHGNYNGQGWNIGALPSILQIKNLIKSVKGIYNLQQISIIFYEYNKIHKELDIEQLKEQKFILPVSGKHNISIVVKQE